MIDLVVILVFRQPIHLMNFLVLYRSTTDNHISGPGGVDQPESIWVCLFMETYFSDTCAEDMFLSTIRQTRFLYRGDCSAHGYAPGVHGRQ